MLLLLLLQLLLLLFSIAMFFLRSYPAFFLFRRVEKLFGLFASYMAKCVDDATAIIVHDDSKQLIQFAHSSKWKHALANINVCASDHSLKLVSTVVGVEIMKPLSFRSHYTNFICHAIRQEPLVRQRERTRPDGKSVCVCVSVFEREEKIVCFGSISVMSFSLCVYHFTALIFVFNHSHAIQNITRIYLCFRWYFFQLFLIALLEL